MFFLFFLEAFLLLACVTINIYFPEATVKKTAEEIVDEVRENPQKEEESFRGKTWEIFFGSSGDFTPSSPLKAQEETEVSTPTIRALKNSLKERFTRLVPFYEAGQIGEGNDGFLHIRDEEQLSLKDKAEFRRLVNEENKDRQALYAEVARALNIDSSQIPRIQKIFAENWIRKAQPGWWIQEEDGKWIIKQER